jgi:hypothetical protein
MASSSCCRMFSCRSCSDLKTKQAGTLKLRMSQKTRPSVNGKTLPPHLYSQMPYRILCNGVKREGVKVSPDLAFGLFSYLPLHKIRYGIHLATTKNSAAIHCRVLRLSVRKDYREYLAYPIVGTTPSCCIRPRLSALTQLSTNFPSAILWMTIPVTVICLPVGGMPIRSPLCVPRYV